MIKTKKVVSFILAGMLSVSALTGCSKGENSNQGSNEMKKIGITQLVEHPALDSSREGFLKALEDNGFKDGENIEVDFQNAQNDMPTTQTIASKFASDKKDLIFAISTPSAQAAFNATKDIPILMTAITDPVKAGLVESLEKPGGNVSGTSDFIPVDKALELVKLFSPDAKTIGVVCNTSEINSKLQIDALKKYASKNNFKVIEKGITTSNEVNQAVSSLVGKADVLYVPTDNLAASSMPIIAKVATENNIPVIGTEDGHVKKGALACQGINYFDLGYKTGEMAVKVLNGESISEMPVTTLEDTELIVNEGTLKALSLEKPKQKNIKYITTEDK